MSRPTRQGEGRNGGGRSVATLGELRLLTAAEVADALRVSRTTVYELDRLGELPSITVSKGASRSRRRWLAHQVAEYVERQIRPVGTPCR